MILLHRLKGSSFVLNASQIENIEANPDTTITLVNDHKYVVKETVEEVIDLVKKYKKELFLYPLDNSR